ncbi:PAS/PAC sensor signal transduction histidine kinase [Lutibacter agarilyticus]|uniref:histidine kinase n=1 Tax=Lutibacter agarilyticus TaxID=1109740 RepID=A0A238YMD4_9FLAO|nr:ATP-binding protein [Lutibacter agarilyticus]SNR72190.1 PAS/PAC sensor signal transduction histidine kinase [Lutibacter agarilyticus]
MFHQNPNIFDILFEAIPEGVIVVNEKRMIAATNASIEGMFCYKKEELIHQPIEILIPKKYHLEHPKHFDAFLKKSSIRKISNNVNLVGITKNNKEFPIEIGLNPFKVNGSTYIIALIIDITKRRDDERKIKFLNSKLEKKIKLRTLELENTINQLKQLNKDYKSEIKRRIEAEIQIKDALKKERELNELKTKFLSMVSHEFKTPLSGILTSATLFGKYKLEDQQQNRDKHIDIITNKVRYLNNIINDFLSIERLESNKVVYKFSEFNLSKIVNEVVYNSNLLLKPGQQINTSKNSDAYILYQDEKILELVLTNIINNAIKYSPQDTTINLEFYKEKKAIVFKVTDKGIGIPKKDQKFIFNRYFRAENALNSQGTGIGLNIVKSHLENLGGSIIFRSKENEGSMFKFELPMNYEKNFIN